MGGERRADLATDADRDVGDSPWIFVCQIHAGDVQTVPKEYCAEVKGSVKTVDRQGYRQGY